MCTFVAITKAEETTDDLIDLILPFQFLDSADRQVMQDLLTDCTVTDSYTTLFKSVLNTTQTCSKQGVFTGTKDKVDKCILKIDDLLQRNTALQFLAEPRLSASDFVKLSECATGTNLAHGMAVVLDRYTPCDLDIKQVHIDIFEKVLGDSMQARSNKLSLQNICLNMEILHDASKLANDFFVGVMKSFSTAFTNRR
jgi:hypothetical protein